MPALLIRHRVPDLVGWRPVFDAQEATRRAHGCQSARLFCNASDPNERLIFLESASIDRAWLFALSAVFREKCRQTEITDELISWSFGGRSGARLTTW